MCGNERETDTVELCERELRETLLYKDVYTYTQIYIHIQKYIVCVCMCGFLQLSESFVWFGECIYMR